MVRKTRRKKNRKGRSRIELNALNILRAGEEKYFESTRQDFDQSPNAQDPHAGVRSPEMKIMSRKILTVCLSLILIQTAIAQDLPQPKLTPVSTMEKHAPLIRQGVALHDQGDYDGAIRVYEEVLKENPDDTVALYEMAYSYSEKKDYKKSLEIAYRGAGYKSKQLFGFYVLIGNNLDNIGRAEDAVKTYRAGIKMFPEESLLHFNLGITHFRQNKLDEAKKSFKEAVTFNPNHPGSHIRLGDVYFKENYRIPALLAMGRFLVLEPKSERATYALQVIRDVLGRAATRDEKTGNINITLDLSAKTDEGDFSTALTMLGLVGAARHLDENKNKTEMQLIVEMLESLLSIISEGEAKKKQSGFAWNYYRPYFLEMKARNMVEPFCYYIYQTSQSTEVAKWLGQNTERVNEFLSWSRTYQWPRVK
jgi:tetratricopeptide (TPR) repeat protein